MNNDSNAVRGRHLESLANMFIGKITSVDSIVAGLLEELEPFTGATSIRGGTDGLVPAPAAGDEVKFLCGDGTWSTVESGSCVLDTVCPSVNGGMWYEVANGVPIVKIYYNGTEYPLGSAEDTELSVVPSPLNVPVGGSATATISCNSGGEITVTSLTTGVRVERSGNVITVYYAAGIDTANIKISAAATLGYTPAEIQLPVRMAAADPNLSVTLTSSSTINVDSPNTATATVSYASACTGTLNITASPNVPYTYENGVISVPYADIDGSVTFTVSLTASPGYLAATETFTVTMAKLDPNLTVTPSADTVPIDGSITAVVSYSGGGNITAKMGDTVLSYSENTITIPYVSGIENATITVELTAAYGYTAASTTFTVAMEQPVILTITPIAPRKHSVYAAYSSENVIVRNTTTTVSCLSNGTISVRSDRDEVVPTYDEETQKITIPFYNFGRDTEVTITVSVTADGIYPAAQASLVVTYAGDYKNMTELTGWSNMLNAPTLARLQTAFPFNTSPTQDLFCGASNTSVSTNGSPTISDNALFLDGQSAVVKTNPSTMTQLEMGVRFWFRILPDTPIGACIFDLWNTSNNRANSVYLQYNGTANGTYKLRLGHGTAYADTSCPTTGWHHIEVGFDDGRIYCFINGNLSINTTTSLTKAAFSYLYIGRSNTSPTKYFTGYIDGFKIYETMLNRSAYSAPPRPTY